MATSEQSRGNSAYVDAVIKPLRHWVTKWFLLLELVLIVGGYLIAQQGPDPETLAFTSSVPFEVATGVVMAALAVAFALMVLVVYAGMVVIDLRSRTSAREF